MKLEVSPCTEENLPYVLTPELVKVRPYPDGKARPIKEILEFPVRELAAPHDTFRNMLFVNPKELNFSNRGLRDLGSARNLTVKVKCH